MASAGTRDTGPTWPEGKRFAFTVFDDTDEATLGNVAPVYAFLEELGLRTTKSVWPARGAREPLIGGSTCDDPDYLDWVRGLAERGFEIAFHMATYHTSTREETVAALERFREVFGRYPRSMANHARRANSCASCRDKIAWRSTTRG